MKRQGAMRENDDGDEEKKKKKKKMIYSLSGLIYHFSINGISVAAATSLTHPLDVLKVRLQMQLVGQRGPLTGMGGLFVQLVKSEGPGSMYLGLTPALMRSFTYGGLRLGLYEPSKHLYAWAFESTNVLGKVASGACSGAFATALTNPMEVLKVRLQMNPNLSRGVVTAIGKIAQEEGITALWKGVGPAMIRAAALTASQLATYDESKRVLIKRTSVEEGICLHLISSVLAGTVSTLVTAPLDMIKTRLMLQQKSERGGTYKNGFHCAYEVMRTEGLRGLYKGGFATFARLGPQTTITFIVCERLRELAGLKAI